MPRLGGSPHRITIAATMIVSLVLLGASCGSKPDRSATAFCDAYVNVATAGGNLGDPSEVAIATLQSQLGRIDDEASDAATHAPKDIRGAVDAVVTPLHELRRQIDKATTRGAVSDAFRTYRRATAKVVDRQDDLDAWTKAHCGVTPVTTTTSIAQPRQSITG